MGKYHRLFSTDVYWKLMRKNGPEVKTRYNQEKVEEKTSTPSGREKKTKTALAPGSKANAIRNPLPLGRGRELSHKRPSNDERAVFSL